MNRITDDHEQKQVAEWLTPSPDDVLSFRSLIVTQLASGHLSETELRTRCDVEAPTRLQVTVPRGGSLVGDVLTAENGAVQAHRKFFTFQEALRQLKRDNVVDAIEATRSFDVHGKRLTANGSSGFNSEKFLPNPAAGLHLTSNARGWTSTDHEAFDPALYAIGHRSRLVTSDGQALLEEALAAFRAGRYLSATIVLGTFAETAWFEAARLVESNAQSVAQELQKPMPAISRVQDAVIKHFEGHKGPARYLAGSLNAWANSTRTVRNFGAHGNLTGATTGTFTGPATAVRIMDSYRHLEELEQALQEVGS